MSYCKIGDKPTINYSFADGKHSSYQSDKSPIDVVLKPYNPEFTGGQCYTNYQVDAYAITSLGHRTTRDLHIITAYYSGIVRGKIQDIPRAYPGEFTGGFVISTTGYGVFSVKENGERNIVITSYVRHEPPNVFPSEYSSNYAIKGEITSVTRTDNQPDNCGDPKKAAQIIVSHQGQEIFSDYGEAPGTFSVACEGCPEGTIRCEQPGYPGYCCLPCDPIAQRINNLAARIK